MKFFFQHIPKTAGSTVRDLFLSRYAKSDLLISDDPLLLVKEDFSSYKGLIGHLTFNEVSSIFQPDLFFTVIRNPVDRAISAAHHVLRDSNFISGEFPKLNTVDQVIENPVFQENFRDGTIKFFASNGNINDALEIAKKYSFIGIFENLEKNLNVIFKTLGVNPVSKLIKLNSFNKNELVSDSSYNILKELLSNDMYLYKEIANYFNSKLEENTYFTYNNISSNKISCSLDHTFHSNGAYSPEEKKVILESYIYENAYYRWLDYASEFYFRIPDKSTLVF
jgi:hypothetical protein